MRALPGLPTFAALMVIGFCIRPGQGAGQTFSDANCMSLGSGMTGGVYSPAVTEGTLYAAGSNAAIYANANLASGPWVPLATNGLGLGPLIFTDPLATNYTGRFYRVGFNNSSNGHNLD